MVRSKALLRAHEEVPTVIFNFYRGVYHFDWIFLCLNWFNLLQEAYFQFEGVQKERSKMWVGMSSIIFYTHGFIINQALQVVQGSVCP